MERDKAAGLACSAGEAEIISFFSSPFGCKALNKPSLLTESYLIPSVSHIELFAASSGSSILSVLGTRIELSESLDSERSSPGELLGLSNSPFLECLPSGELGPEVLVVWFVAGGVVGTHDTFQGLGVPQFQYGAG